MGEPSQQAPREEPIDPTWPIVRAEARSFFKAPYAQTWTRCKPGSLSSALTSTREPWASPAPATARTPLETLPGPMLTQTPLDGEFLPRVFSMSTRETNCFAA